MSSSDFAENATYDKQRQQEKAEVFRKTRKRIFKIVIGIILAMVILIALVVGALLIYLKKSSKASIEEYKDVTEYSSALEKFQGGSINELWPDAITDDMDVQDFYMQYYQEYSSNYLGYMVVQYTSESYTEEVQRLTQYESTDYVGLYGATGFSDYNVAAMLASTNGFQYALLGEDRTIIYVEMIFPGYGMDIDYEKYIPEQYLPGGFDATEDNPTRQEILERHEKSKNN